MFYVYIHLRLDTGEIFYVGKGSKKRAWSYQPDGIGYLPRPEKSRGNKTVLWYIQIGN